MRRQQTFDLSLPTEFDRDNFLVTESNLEAYGWLNQWPEWPSRFLAIYGDPGCGKSHMGKIWVDDVKGVALTAADFDTRLLNDDAKNILIDNADQIGDEEKLFHLYNRINQEGGTVLLLSQAPPCRWKMRLADLKSRMNSISAVEILPPDDNSLEGVLKKLFNDRQLRVDDNVIQFLVRNTERSFKSAVELVEILDKRALQDKRNITLPFVRQIVAEVETAKSQKMPD